MNVHTRNPRCSVRFVSLEKRYGEFTVDFTKGSIRQVSVHRRMGEAAGAFQIVLLPRESGFLQLPGLPGHWRDMLGAMDYVEITLHVPPRLPKIVMRGFIDTVTEEFSIHGGTPERVIIINGRDYGKLLLITRLYYTDSEEGFHIPLLKAWKEGMDRIFSWRTNPPPPISDALPIGGDTNLTKFQPKEFMQNVIEAFYRPQEDNILKYHPHAPRLDYHALDGALIQAGDPTLSTVAPQMIPLNYAPFTDLWTILRIYQHHPWRELYIEEGTIAPRLLFRPTPWLDFHGTPVQALFELYEDTLPHHVVSEDTLVEYSLSHSDEEVRNFFSVSPDNAGAFVQMVKTVGPLEGLFQSFRINPYLVGIEDRDDFEETGIMKRSNYKIAGFRLFDVRTPYLDFDRRVSEKKIKEKLVEIREQGARGNEWIRRAMDHGAVLEFGVIHVRGNEGIGIGHYLQMDSGPRLDLGQGARYYVEGVSHVFRQGSSPSDGIFMTTCEVSRGRGHLVRKGMAIA